MSLHDQINIKDLDSLTLCVKRDHQYLRPLLRLFPVIENLERKVIDLEKQIDALSAEMRFHNLID